MTLLYTGSRNPGNSGAAVKDVMDGNDRDSCFSMRTFSCLVYCMVTGIPYGRVTTYGAVARGLGYPRKAREVGWALHAKPEEVIAPAHRVVNREGQLSGGWAFGGPEIQRALLESESVTFLPDGRVDLDKHLWLPNERAASSD